MAQVQALCGSPMSRIVEEFPVRARTTRGFSRFIGITTTEQWIYDRGWGRFPAVLHFHDANSDVSGICPTDPEHAEPVQQSTKSLYIRTACISIQNKGW